MSQIQNLYHSLIHLIEGYWSVMGIGDILDVAFIALLISIGSVWLRRRAGRAIIVVLVPILIVFSAARELKMLMTSAIFQFGLTAIFMCIVVIFQDDFRRIFESLAAWRPWGERRALQSGKLSDIFFETLTTLSKNKIGALIVLQGRQAIEPFSRAGIPLYGALSTPLLLSIFDPHSPGHDGGVVIVDGRISKFGVHLPLSREVQNTGRLGTRHAAALGIVEKCDALVFVVSEETGTISIAKNGKIAPINNESEIRGIAIRHLRRNLQNEVEHTFREMPWMRLATSSLLALIMWVAYARPYNLIVRTVEATIVYKNLPKGWEAKAPDPLRVELTLLGPEGSLMQVEQLSVPVDVSSVVEGRTRFVLGDAGLSLPSRVRVKRFEPADIIVNAYQTIDVDVPVRPKWLALKGRTPTSALFRIEPSHVTIKMPKLAIRPQLLETESIDWNEFNRSGHQKVKLQIPADIPSAELNPKEVEIIFTGGKH